MHVCWWELLCTLGLKYCVHLQIRVEVQYRQPLSLPVTVEVHAINDAAHSKVATWLPEADKMQAELEGNRISRTLNVRCYTPGLSVCLELFLSSYHALLGGILNGSNRDFRE